MAACWLSSGFAALSVGELWVIPLDANYSPAGEPRRVTAAPSMSEPQWVPGTKDIVFSSGPDDRPSGGCFGSRHKKACPNTACWRLARNATGLSISKNGRMIYSRTRSDSNIWLLDSGQSGITKPAIASTTGGSRARLFAGWPRCIYFDPVRNG